jgi:hypothetical protein
LCTTTFQKGLHANTGGGWVGVTFEFKG